MSQLPSEGESLFTPRDLSAPDNAVEIGRSAPRNYDELIARIGEESAPAPKKLPPAPTVPAGWYPDPENTGGFGYGGVPSMRYFDGEQWTDHRVPMQRSQQRYPQQPIIVTQQVAQPMPIVVNNSSSSTVGLHLVLTILTCGLWLPVWLIIEIIQAGSRR